MNRSKLEIAYSIGVMIAIPVIVVVNTIILTLSTGEAYEYELARKANLVNSVIAETSLQFIQDKQYDTLSKKLDNLESLHPALKQSMVIVENDHNLQIVAHSSSASIKIDQILKNEVSLVIDNKNMIAAQVDIYDKENNLNKAWKVLSPVVDENDEVIAIVSTSLSTADAQEMIDRAYQLSIIVLSVSILLIIGLLFRHFKLVGYVKLLAKQRELNQTMSDFLSVATHELKAPTTIIKGYLSNVLEGDFGEVKPEVKEQIDVAMSQTDRLNSLVQDLLNVSRVEQGRVQYNFTAVNTTKIINTIVENYKPIAEEKGLKLIYEPDANLPIVYADEGRVQEVFTNLIDNAIKYTAKGSVTIAQRQEKGIVITNIRDTGFGMSPEARQRLFQRFYRVKTEQTQGIPGTGLGLWIIKQYIEAMKGSIDIETMEGVGSNFIVKLQVDKQNPGQQ